MNGARKLVTRNHLTRKKLLAQKQRFGGGGKKVKKARGTFVFRQTFFYAGINGGRVRAWKAYKTQQRGENSYGGSQDEVKLDLGQVSIKALSGSLLA